MPTGHEGDVSFKQLIAGDLAKTITAVPQSLDNQWLDNELVAETLEVGKVTGAISKKQQRRARREYLRALLNAEKIIINRAYLYNSETVHQDFVRDGPGRKAFRSLLKDGVIIPFLMNETSPLPEVTPDFHVTDGFEGWRTIAENTPMSCLRLAWDEHTNAELSTQVSDGFENFLTRLGKFRAPALQRDLGLSKDEAESVCSYLKQVAAWAFERTNSGTAVTRQMLYERFIVGDGGNVAAREYDRNLPHVVPLQEGLADRRQAGRRPLDETDADQLVRLLRGLTFENVQGLLEDVPSLDRLTLTDICQVRKESEWKAYKDLFADLLNTSSVDALASDAGGAVAVTGAYLAMLEKAEEIHITNWGDHVGERFQGLAELAIDIGAMTINILYLNNHSIGYQVIGDSTGMGLGRAARVTVRLGLGRLLGSKAKHRIESTAQILDMRMDNPTREAQKIVDYLADHGERLKPTKNGPDQSNEGE
jgi:hypothetical protein